MVQRIDDHSNWIGKGSNGTVFPEGVKMKQESSDGHSGNLSEYEDTTEAIKRLQQMNSSKAKAHPLKAPNRN